MSDQERKKRHTIRNDIEIEKAVTAVAGYGCCRHSDNFEMDTLTHCFGFLAFGIKYGKLEFSSNFGFVA